MGLSNKQQAFVTEYLRDFNATQAAIRAGYSENAARGQGSRLLANADISAAINERKMNADEVLLSITEQGRSDIGVFFKLVEEWTAYPLPSYDILGAEERVIDEDTNEKKEFYFTRHVAIDLDKLLDPQYSKLVKKFNDSPKNGVTLELYDKQSALALMGKHHKQFVDRTELTGADGGAIAVEVFGKALDKVYGSDGA